MDNRLILLLLLVTLNQDSQTSTDKVHKLKDYTKDFKVDYRYTKEKITILKNILPYLPADYIKTGVRSVYATERLLQILDVIESLNVDYAVPQALEVDSMERTYRIISTLQDEINNSNIDQLGTILDVMVNKDHYKEMVDMALELISSKEGLRNPNSLSKILKMFLGEKEMDNNNLNKLLDILEMLDSSNKDKEQPNNPY